MNIDKNALYELYMKKVNQIAEDCDWVTSFGPEEIVYMIANIIENNPHLISE